MRGQVRSAQSIVVLWKSPTGFKANGCHSSSVQEEKEGTEVEKTNIKKKEMAATKEIVHFSLVVAFSISDNHL